LAGVAPSAAWAQIAPEALGASIAQRNCSQCHAVGLKGQSPNPNAPPFRSLDRRFVVRELDQAALDRLMGHHAGMPRFRTTRREREGLIAYLKSLQTYKDASLSAPSGVVRISQPRER
jgi:mono/diheme cytochrome c family protein